MDYYSNYRSKTCPISSFTYPQSNNQINGYYKNTFNRQKTFDSIKEEMINTIINILHGSDVLFIIYLTRNDSLKEYAKNLINKIITTNIQNIDNSVNLMIDNVLNNEDETMNLDQKAYNLDHRKDDLVRKILFDVNNDWSIESLVESIMSSFKTIQSCIQSTKMINEDNFSDDDDVMYGMGLTNK